MSSSKFNLYVLRRLFNPQQSGSGEKGKQRRIPLKITLTPPAQVALRDSVPTGKGQYASATIELALRFMLALVGKLDLEHIGEAMSLAIIDRAQFVKNLRSIADYIESYITADEWADKV